MSGASPSTSAGAPAKSPIPIPIRMAVVPPAVPYHSPPARVYVPAVPYPRMVRVRQHVEAPAVADVPLAVRGELERIRIGRCIRAGESVAITAGRRGIADIGSIPRRGLRGPA